MLRPRSLLDRFSERRQLNRETQRLRIEAEFDALYASWSQESGGHEQTCTDATTLFCADLRNTTARHEQLLKAFGSDLDKFLYAAPIRLAKLEAEYSWKFDQELHREIEQVLEGMLENRTAEPLSLAFLARYRQSFPSAFSRPYLVAELKRRFNEQRRAPRAGFQLTLDYARTLSGLAFEEWLARLLRDAGIPGVVITQASRDQGADLVITAGSRKIVVQAKQCQETIGNSAVQQVHGALPYYDATEAWVVTTSNFSKDATDLAFRTGVRLVSGNQLLNLPALLREAGGMPVQAASASVEGNSIPAQSAQVAGSDHHRTAPCQPAAYSINVMRDRDSAVPQLDRVLPSKHRNNWKLAWLGTGIVLLSVFAWITLSSFGRGNAQGHVEIQPRIATELAIESLLQNYRAAALRNDPAALAQFYAPTVQTFYLRHNVSRADVRNEFDHIFRRFPEMHSMNFSSFAFRDISPKHATVEFDKSWDALGVARYSGEEREEMKFQKIDGYWQIASERELKIFWTKRTNRGSE